jgi:hypothetical protein
MRTFTSNLLKKRQSLIPPAGGIVRIVDADFIIQAQPASVNYFPSEVFKPRPSRRSLMAGKK